MKGRVSCASASFIITKGCFGVEHDFWRGLFYKALLTETQKLQLLAIKSQQRRGTPLFAQKFGLVIKQDKLTLYSYGTAVEKVHTTTSSSFLQITIDFLALCAKAAVSRSKQATTTSKPSKRSGTKPASFAR